MVLIFIVGTAETYITRKRFSLRTEAFRKFLEELETELEKEKEV